MIKVFKIKVLSTLLVCLFSFTTYSQSSMRFKVALDAGHGAHDFGAVYNGHVEKNIALAVVLKVGKILERQSNIDIIYTRKTDVFIELVERSSIANRADANIFVSIHCNANSNTSADGSETYVMGLNKNASNLAVAKSENAVITLEKDYKQKYSGFDPNNPSSMIGMTLMQEEYLDNSITLASKIQDQFINALSKKSRGVKQAPFMVLHKAYMPRVLIEMGFISNPKEGALLDSDEGQQEIAQSIADAIIGYKKEYYGSGANDTPADRPSKRQMDLPVVVDSSESSKSVNMVEKSIPNKEVVNKDASCIVFKVQLTAVARKIELTAKNFKGLENISVTTDNGRLYKYANGASSNLEQAKQNLAEAKSKGYSTAYIIAFKDGKKINMQDAQQKST